MDRNRRTVRNVLVNGQAQARFAMSYLIVMAGAAALLAWAVILTFRGLQQIATAVQETQPEVVLELESLRMKLLSVSVSGLVILGLLTFVIWLVYTHRIFGPMVAIKRQIREIEEGRRESDISLRRNDEFKDLLEDLKRLQKNLGQPRS